MRIGGVLMAVAAVGSLGGQALADPGPVPPAPTVSAPTVSVPAPPPPVVVPLPTIPKLPPPVLAAPPPAARPSAPHVSVSAPAPLPSGAVGIGGGSSSPSRSQSSRPSGSRSTPSRRPTVKHFHSTRTWIAANGPRRHRSTMLTFVLPRATRVVFLVNQLSPSCRASGRFSVAGHPGLNRIRFAGRVSGRRLGPGTYRISARTTAGRPLRRVTLVI